MSFGWPFDAWQQCYPIDHVSIRGEVTMRSESDGEFRNRVLYVAGDSPAERQRIEIATSKELEEIGARHGLKRRQYPA